ncbi:Holliday junction branch migration protein RuvA [bacterium]|nr:Holliday junction branch migration protein RuvA [bacterium]
MIATLRGKLTFKSPTSVVIETGGVGFLVHIPVSSLETLGETGEDVSLYTHLHVREDAMQLYGFATQSERDLFLSLIAVSGIGPKLAQGVLSGISVEQFYRAIEHQDVAALSHVPGIGKKTAERLVLELKDKIGGTSAGGPPGAGLMPAAEEAVMALLSLGYKRQKVEPVVQNLIIQDRSLSIEELIRRALREM